MQDRTRMFALILLGLASLLAPARAQDEQPEAKPTKKAEAIPAAPLIRPGQAASQEPALSEFEKLEREYDNAYEDWVAKVMAMTEEERAAGYPDQPGAEFFPRFAKLAEAGDIPALAWVLDNYYLSGLTSEQMEAMKVRTLKKLVAHPESEDAAEAVANALMYSSPLPVPETIAILDKMIAKVKHADALAALHFSLAQVLMHQPDEASKKRAIEVLRIIDSKYPDSFYGRFAKGLIFETQNLQVGMLAPEFAGNDVHGNPIKLSDYRGKVTFLVFWGFW
jgi:hypothetical protein